MKKLLLTIAILALSFGIANAETITLAWDLNPLNEPGTVKGYTIYFTDDLGATFNKSVVGETATTMTIDNLAPGRTYTFAARAYNDSGESVDSNSAEHTTLPVWLPPADKLPATLVESSPVNGLRIQ